MSHRGNRLSIAIESAVWMLGIAMAIAFAVIKIRTWGGSLAAPEQSDFPSFYIPACIVRTTPSYIYEPEKWPSLTDSPVASSWPYIYPPILAWELRPLCWFPYETARRIWFWTGVAALLLGGALSIYYARSARWAWFGAVLWLLLPSSLDTLYLGQVNMYLALLWAVGFVGYLVPRVGYQFLGGWAIALAAGIKVFPVFQGGAGLFRRRYFLAGLFTGLGALLVIQLVVFGDQLIVRYVSKLSSDSTQYLNPSGVFFFLNQSTLASFTKLGLSQPVELTLRGQKVGQIAPWPLLSSAAASILGWGTVGAILVATVSKTWANRGRSRPELEWALWQCAVWLITPVVWSHYAVMLLPVLWVLLKHYGSFRWWWRWAIPMGYFLLTAQRGVVLWLQHIPFMGLASLGWLGMIAWWLALIGVENVSKGRITAE